ncbi:LexA family protein [Oceanobacillus damuensis]|uniref:LexA family protein n=1 Tax=Oceanobacillus damuensis TaxID=937928 RepID=UPI00082F4106|nr:XRE family transcriptional regulator [Oceanobacillus damuensis]
MRSSKEVIQLIQNMRKNKKLSLDELAKKVGVSKSTLSRYESGKREFPINNIEEYAKALDTSVEHLLGIDNLYTIESNYVDVPVLGQIACGEPIYVEENFEGYRTEPKNSLTSGNFYYLQAKGKSMSPTIPENAFVLIREQPDVDSGEIAAILVNGESEATLKRIRKYDDYMILVPDNSNFDPIVSDKNSPCKIIGKAIRYTLDL